MGRKLNALEELQASFADSSADRQQSRAHLSQRYHERIAATLGITTAELGSHPALPNAIQTVADIGRQNELILAQQCADLVKAFIQIQDPQDRLRCLQLVRDAALGHRLSRGT